MRPVERTETNYDDVPLPALLRATRGVYTNAVRRAQSRIGCADLPATGDIIVSAMGWNGGSLESVVRWLGVSKQAVSQAVDTLVDRGYLERARDPTDRRRVKLSLTDRGEGAARAARSAIEQIDRELSARMGPRGIAQTRATLLALLDIKRKDSGQARGRPLP
jgi:DNA-binding MarR family transcriptional regulator